MPIHRGASAAAWRSALVCLTTLAARPAGAQADDLLPPPASWALSAGLSEAGPGLALVRRSGRWPIGAAVVGGEFGVGASVQLRVPRTAEQDDQTEPYLSGGAFRFLRPDERGHTPTAWSALGGVRHWPSGPRGPVFESGLGLWGARHRGSYGGNTGGFVLRLLAGWAL